MSRIFFLLGSQFVLEVVQLYLGKLGLALPLTEFGAIYCAVAFGTVYGAAAGILSGMNAVIFFGFSTHWVTFLLDPALAAGIGYWITRHEEHRSMALWIPGALAGGLAGVNPLLMLLPRWGFNWIFSWEISRFFLQWLYIAVLSSLLFPVVVLLGELIVEYLGMPRFLLPARQRRRL